MPTWDEYSAEPIDNQAAPPVGAPEGNYKGSNVNNTFRYMMAVIYDLGARAMLAPSQAATTLSAGTRRLTDLLVGTALLDGATRSQALQGGLWCGTSAGTVNAQTLTPTVALPSYAAGQRFHAIIGASLTNTGALTMAISGLSALAVRDPMGAALTGGEVVALRRHTFEHDGTALRVLDPVNWMDQASYDADHPVGDVLYRRDETDPNTLRPSGVTAIWTRQTTAAYLRVATGTPGSGGSLNTSTQAEAEVETDPPTQGSFSGVGGGASSYPRTNHTHNVTIPAIQLTIEPTYLGVAVWVRTA